MSFFFCGWYHASMNLDHSLRTFAASVSGGGGGGGGGGSGGGGVDLEAGCCLGAGVADLACAPRRFGGMGVEREEGEEERGI